MKLLSFIIPAYNSEAFLDVCIPSMLHPGVLDQLEIIVVNDGSTDDTPSVAARYCDAYPDTVRLINQENKGHGGALNTGCAAASGKYLKVIDADDWVDTENLPAFLAALKHCDCDVVLTHYRTVDISNGETKLWKCFPDVYGNGCSFSCIMSQWRRFEHGLTFHGITYRTDFYQAQGHILPEHVFYEDHEYATFPCCMARTITPLDILIYNYRIGDVTQSVSAANQLKRLGHTETVLAHMMEAYARLDPSADSACYARMKLQGLLLSYLTTTLLLHPDRSLGRTLAKKQMTLCRSTIPALFKMALWKYRVFFLMNLLHFNQEHWNSVKNSRLYQRIKKKQPST